MSTIEKSIDYRMVELETALRALKNSNNNFIFTKDNAYLLDLMSRLRTLIAFQEDNGKRKKKSNLHPLLLDLSEELTIPLEFYGEPYSPRVVGPEVITIVSSSAKDWCVKYYPGLVEYNLMEWLLKPIYFVDKDRVFVNRNNIVRSISDKEGGAHYDKETEAVVDNLKRISGSTYNGLEFFLINLSALVYWLGMRMCFIWNCRKNGEDISKDKKIIELDEMFDKLVITMI